MDDADRLDAIAASLAADFGLEIPNATAEELLALERAFYGDGE